MPFPYCTIYKSDTKYKSIALVTCQNKLNHNSIAFWDCLGDQTQSFWSLWVANWKLIVLTRNWKNLMQTIFNVQISAFWGKRNFAVGPGKSQGTFSFWCVASDFTSVLSFHAGIAKTLLNKLTKYLIWPFLKARSKKSYIKIYLSLLQIDLQTQNRKFDCTIEVLSTWKEHVVAVDLNSKISPRVALH